MIRRDLAPRLKALAGRFPAVTLIGPRQSGKSTLARAVFPKHAYANLEAPDTRSYASEDPRSFLAQFEEGVILDEIQRCPQLPSYLQERIDAKPEPGKWILTGSQNLAMMESVSQSLAGRTAVLSLMPLSRGEVCRFRIHPRTLDATILAGGYPRIFDKKIPPGEWLDSYVGTYLERDVRSLMRVGDLSTFQRFLGLCAGRTSQLLNLSSLASDCGISQPTAKAWLSVLEASFIVFRLPFYSRNLNRRLVKMPKLHFCDTGLACWLIGIRSVEHLQTHPLRGALFETWVVSEILKSRLNRGEAGGLSYYRDQHGLEADLIVEDRTRPLVVEVKAGQTVSPDMFGPALRVRTALEPVGDANVLVVYGGDELQERTEVTVVPWGRVHEQAWRLPMMPVTKRTRRTGTRSRRR